MHRRVSTRTIMTEPHVDVHVHQEAPVAEGPAVAQDSPPGAVASAPVTQAWEALPDGRIKCLACGHRCTIARGHTGVCGVRRNTDGKLELLVHSRPISVNVDPVEKKPVYHFLPGTPIMSLGTVGCNFQCDFCQNWDISQAVRDPGAGGDRIDVEDPKSWGRSLPPEEIVTACQRRHIPSIAFTYNEPTIFLEYALDTMRLAKPHGIKSVFVTNGYESEETLQLCHGLIDVMRIDLKAFQPAFYTHHCKAKLDNVLQTIHRAYDMGFWVELVTLLIPGENDSDKEIGDICRFAGSISHDIPMHFSAFHPDFHLTDKPRTPASTVLRACRIANECGQRYAYGGNIIDASRANTFCPNCKALLIERSGHSGVVRGLDSDKGCCKACHTPIPGIWK